MIGKWVNRRLTYLGKCATLININQTGYPCYAPYLSLSRNKIKYIFKRESIKEQFVIVDFYTHCTNASRLRNNNPKPHFSSRFCRFCSIFRRYDRCCCRSCCRWRSIDHDRRIQQTLALDSVFAIAFVCFHNNGLYV